MDPAERRALARRAARSVLATGVTADQLTLRLVAAEADMPLPTLTYVYGAITELLNDLRFEFETQAAATQSCVGSGGLSKELLKMFKDYLTILYVDPSNIEILRWQFQLVGRGEIVLPGGMSMAPCLTKIQAQSGEQWRLSVDDLSTLAQAMISGMHVQFFVRGADRVALRAWWQEARMVVDALVRLAEPGPDPTNYRQIRLPANVTKRAPAEPR